MNEDAIEVNAPEVVPAYIMAGDPYARRDLLADYRAVLCPRCGFWHVHSAGDGLRIPRCPDGTISNMYYIKLAGVLPAALRGKFWGRYSCLMIPFEHMDKPDVWRRVRAAWKKPRNKKSKS